MNHENINHKDLFDQMPVVRFVVERVGEAKFCIATANQKAKLFFSAVVTDDPEGKDVSSLFDSSCASNLCASLEVSFQKKMPVTIPSIVDAVDSLKVHSFWVSPVIDQNGKVILLDVIGKPGSTDLGVVERERDDALSLLTSIFEASEVGILVFDHNRRIVKMNHSFERIYGWSESETIGKDFVELITDDEKNIAQNTYDSLMNKPRRQSGEVKIYCKDGSIANIIYTTAALRLSQGRSFQVVTLFDITKRKNMELSLRVAKEQADASNNAKSAFLANMSHELRTPLNAILGFSEMMMNETFGPLGHKKYTEYTKDVYHSADHLLDIINEVLDMSKIEAGKLDLDEQEFNLNEQVKTLIGVMVPGLLTHDLKVEGVYQEGLPHLYADPRLIRQVLINLITNSIKYSLDDGTIKIITSLNHKDEIEITVSDEGIGIPESRIQEAMEPFGQIHDPHTHSDTFEGTGLGLPLAKAMVEMHGGVFILKSVEGEGTTVIISFSKSRTRHH